MDAIVSEAIQAERDRQDRLWGGPKHDDTHSPQDWCLFIIQQTAKASDYRATPGEFRGRMVKVAALAVAAIESSERTT